MSRPRYYWFGIVKTMIYQYPNNDLDTVKGAEAFICVKRALAETAKLRDGADRLRLIDMVFFKKSHRTYGAADIIHVSESTAKRWVSEFVYLCASMMGYT